MDANKTLSKLAYLCASFFKKQSWNELLTRIVDAGIEATSADRGTIFLTTDVNSTRKKNVLSSIIATGINGRVLKIKSDEGLAGYVYKEQRPIIINKAQEDPRFNSDIDEMVNYQTETVLCVPLRLPNEQPIGCIEFLNSKEGAFTDEDLEVAQILALFASVALDQRFELYDLEDRHRTLLESKNGPNDRVKSDDFLNTKNKELQKVYAQLPSFAESMSNVLIQGDSGTGKELIARYLHLNSSHKSGPFVAVNCAAIPESMFEAELFGVAEGAATGTLARKGKLEMANEGTLFLDEIGDMPPSVQSKLLRVLQDKLVTPVGSDREPIEVDFRVVAATNQDLNRLISEDKFRDDLYYRLSVVNILLPSLKERLEDLPQIADKILKSFVRERGWKKKALGDAALKKLLSYSWPGNIRELQNRLENAFIASGERPQLEPDDFSLRESSPPAETADKPKDNVISMQDYSLKKAKDQVEKEMILMALKKADGNKSEAAKSLDISREGLRKAMKKHKVA